MLMFAKSLHPSQQKLGIIFNVLGKASSVKPLFEKQKEPIYSSVSGKSICFKLVHPEKASSRIAFIDLGRITSDIVAFLKAFSPILITG